MFADFSTFLVQGSMGFMFLILMGCWSIGRLMKKHDPDGQVKGAAKGAAVRLLSNLFLKK